MRVGKGRSLKPWVWMDSLNFVPPKPQAVYDLPTLGFIIIGDLLAG